MKIAVMQPYYFPYIGYFQLIRAVDVFVVYDDVNYIKKGWINRNTILVNGSGHPLRMELSQVSQNKKINQIVLAQPDHWKADTLKTIAMAYKKAPFFDQAFPVIETLLSSQEANLSKFLANLIKQICAYLRIDTKIMVSSQIMKDNSLKGQDRIIEICKKLNATHYINPIGGIGLYDKKDFSDQGMQMNFIKSNAIIYRQFANEFLPWLSIIDVMMFNPVEDIKMFLDDYELV